VWLLAIMSGGARSKRYERSSSVGREPEPLRNKANSGCRGKAAIASFTPDVDAESAILAEGRRYAIYP
jgi:hypothetical protein